MTGKPGKNQLYIENHILMRAGYQTPKRHRHTALQLMIADPSYGRLRCEAAGETLMAPAIMIASDVEHTAAVEGVPVVMLFDVTSNLARNMEQQYLRGMPYYILTDDAADVMQEIMRERYEGLEAPDAGGQNLAALDATILEALRLRHEPVRPMDARIEAVIEDLQTGRNTEQDPYARACDIACLSQSRFSHLFREEAQISFRSYLVMYKLRVAYEWYLKGLSVTEISMRAGFDSPSHFASTIHRMFGLSFTDFARGM